MKKTLVFCGLLCKCDRAESGEQGGEEGDMISSRWNHHMLTESGVVRRILSSLGVVIPAATAVVIFGSLFGCKGEIRFSHTCGDGVAQGSEVCDGDDLRGEDCVSQGYTGGTLGCNEGCDGYDTSQCTGSGPVCGDGVAQGVEVCDGDDLRGEDCVSQGYIEGELGCNEGCDGYDTSQCTGSGPVCGDGVAQGVEVCDGDDLRGEDCVSQGYTEGELMCSEGCDGYDTSQCTGSGPVCGDGVAQGVEVCDGDDLRGEDCVSQGFTGGTLSCDGECNGYNTSGCFTSVCGNDAAEEGEVCDGDDLRGEDCVSQGFTGGSLSCDGECNGYNTSGCFTSVCGNDVAEEGEVCDGDDLRGEDCVSQGFSSGSLACNGDCTGFVTTNCSATEVELICNRWNMDRADRSEGTWSGSISSCDAGDISALGRANALKMVNLYRFIAGLPEVTTNSGRDEAAQECALMMDANGQLSHSPPSTWDCYTSTGAGAAGSSNIAGGPGVQAVDMYMDDYGNSSTLGHRRWILSNSLGSIGLGSTSSYSCMWVIGTGGNAGAQWTAWPSPGVFPFEAISTLYWSSLDDTGWSFQSDGIGLSNAEVTVTSGGQDLPVTVTNLLSGYGSSSAISFIPDGWSTQPDTNYTVEITGISSPVTYEVQVVQCN